MNVARLTSSSAAQTRSIGAALGAALQGGELITLRGELGAGKTCLVRGLADGLGIPPDTPMPSPTFVLLRSYVGRCVLHHLDCYRLAPGELHDLGWDELTTLDAVVAVEWAEREPSLRGQEHLGLSLNYGAALTERLICVTGAHPAVETLARHPCARGGALEIDSRAGQRDTTLDIGRPREDQS